MENRTYLCIDLKSFYASVECVDMGLNPMTAKLVVADPDRSEKTICLAVSPALKQMGVKNRCRVFEIPPHIDYIMARPRMRRYIEVSAEIYAIYLRYVSREDIHVYSVDEAFLDVTNYLQLYHMTAKEMAVMLMDRIARELGIRATCGIGTNLYLTKIALDITAKHAEDYIGVLDEETYRRTLWDHRPLTDFWRIGRGTAARLEKYGIFTMRQIANMDEEFFYQKFGIDAELLIDHAWGREPTTIQDIHKYKPKSTGISIGQVLSRGYSFEEGRLILKEMLDGMCLDLVDREAVTKSVTIGIGYEHGTRGDVVNGTASLEKGASAETVITPAVLQVYDRIVDPDLQIRRIYVSCSNILPEDEWQQTSLFDVSADVSEERHKKVQQTVLSLKRRFGKNAILKGMNLEKASTARERNHQIGGHRDGEES